MKGVGVRKFIFKSSGLALLAAGLAAVAAPKPNVLFIVVDDLRPQLGCYGDKQMISPNIDRLASEGALFDRAYCQVPVCGASRASLMTGLRPTPTRFVDYDTWVEKDAPDVADLPGWFLQHGYDTFSMGKVYHFYTDKKESWTQLGDTNITGKGWCDYQRTTPGMPGPSYESADVPDEKYCQSQIADAAIARLQKISLSGKPAFLAVGFTKPHLPFVAPKKYWDLYDHDGLKLAPNPFQPRGAPNEAMHNFDELRAFSDIPKGKAPIPDDLALSLIHGYYACVSFADAMVGRVLDELDRLGMQDNTIVVLWGDNGWQLGEHALWCKHDLFNTALHVPLMIRAPGIKPSRTDALVEFLDVYPTLCELAGIPSPGHLQGKSVVPLLHNPSASWKPAVFSRYRDGESVQTERYRYSEWKNGARMLYDHQNDPDENTNISENPENKTIIENMQQLLRENRETP